MMGRKPGDSNLDQALRSALHLAVDSVEPGADGLDQIRAKIATRQATRARLRPNYRFWQNWQRSSSAQRRSHANGTRPAWVLAALAEVGDRFRPDLGRPGWLSWLRPAAAAVTALFVVSAAGLAVTALPAAISTVAHSVPFNSPGSPSSSRSKTASSQQSYPTPGGGGPGIVPPVSTHGAPNPWVSPSCTISPSPSSSTTGSQTPPDTSPPTSSNPTTSPSTPPDTGTVSPPANSPPAPAASTSTPAPDGSASPDATGKVLLSSGAMTLDNAVLAPNDPSPTPTDTVSPPSPAPTSPPVPPVPCHTP
ncbi:MAG TPA: hypothetical protein VFQ44_15660 [Streptosporangiaceae bacterium]|nr:hypothetical protein [Streptosporangiaceae bacterium]